MDFDQTTLKLLASARNGRISIRCFMEHFPELGNQLRTLVGANWLNVWGSSYNHDELARKKIVDPKLLNVIGRIARYPIRQGRAYHAGLTHTYGYVMSLIETPFGFKRDRWTSGILEKGLGLPRDCFQPHPRRGTLLGNLSYFLCRACLRNRAATALFTGSTWDPELSRFAFGELKIRRMTETTTWRNSPFWLYSDWIPFQRPIRNHSGALIYSYRKGKGRQKLATVFPVTEDWWNESKRWSRQNPSVRTRYNLAIEGYPRDGKPGSRRWTTLNGR